MLGKYDNSYNILELPKLYNSDHINNNSEYYTKYKKILDPNNSAYIDGFFSFLSSCETLSISFLPLSKMLHFAQKKLKEFAFTGKIQVTLLYKLIEFIKVIN